MRKLFLTLALVAGLIFGSASGCVSPTGMKPDVRSMPSMPSMEYTALDFFDDDKPYFLPKYIKVLEAIWMHDVERLTDNLLLMHYIQTDEVITFVVNKEKLVVLSMVYARTGADIEYYIYDSKPYPVKVTEAEMETYVDTQIKQETL